MLIETRLGHRLSMEVLFQAPTIETLARYLARDASAPYVSMSADAKADTAAGAIEKITFRQLRPARGKSLGIVLGMPDTAGRTGQSAVISAHAFSEYEVWGTAVNLNGQTLLQEQNWLLCARMIAEQLLEKAMQKPLALFGFSIGGYLAWLVDRHLVAAGWEPVPVINFDAVPLHTKAPYNVPSPASLIPDQKWLPQARMLLLQRATPGSFESVNESDHRWRAIGLIPQTISFRTLNHMDLALPVAIAASSHAITAYVAAAGIAPIRAPVQAQIWHGDPVAHTHGSRLFGLLDAKTVPDAAQLSELMQQSALVNDHGSRYALLFLVLLAGDAERALAFARRDSEFAAGFRPYTYVQVALLHLLGRDQEATGIVADWCALHPQDLAMQNRLTRTPQPALSWEAFSGLVLGSDLLLDRAVDSLTAFPRI